jgi:hypothetical protein
MLLVLGTAAGQWLQQSPGSVAGGREIIGAVCPPDYVVDKRETAVTGMPKLEEF